MFTCSFRGRFFDIYRSSVHSDVQIVHHLSVTEKPFALERVTQTENSSETSTLQDFTTLEDAITFAKFSNV
jgi:hypothetical protein